ncbi:MAG: hypothetical protein MRY32_07460 [Rickettsiales bacterium]|nr:hypothetical protein [Rickettsiales bacterium]
MKLYCWNNDPIVKKLTFEHERKYPTAYLRIEDGLPTQTYEKTIETLRMRGMKAFADNKDGAPVLRITGFKKDEQVLGALQEAGIITQPADLVKEALDTDKPTGIAGFKQWVADNSMVASGISYLAADALAFASGFVRRDLKGKRDGAGMAQGLLWGSSSLMLAIYGTRNPKRQMENLYYEMENHIKNQGIELTDEEKHTLTSLKGTTENFYDRSVNFVYQHPVELNNSIQGLGGLMLAQAGMNQKVRNWDKNPLKPGNTPNYAKVAAGLLVASSFFASMLMTEDQEAGLTEEERQKRFFDRLEGKDVPDAPDISFWESPIKWVKQKPLRLAGNAAILNNLLVAYSGWIVEPRNLGRYYGQIQGPLGQQVKESEAAAFASGNKEQILGALDKRSAFEALENEQLNRVRGAKFDKWTPIPNIVANYLYAMSPKDRRGVLKEDGYIDELISMAANVYERLPEDKRHEPIDRFASFMSTKPEVKSSIDEIEEKIYNRIYALEHNPWTEKSRHGEIETRYLSRQDRQSRREAERETQAEDDIPTNEASEVMHVKKGIAEAMAHSPVATA